MIDRIFAAVLTFCVLVGATLAVASAMLGRDQRVAAPKAAASAVRVVQLERVVVVAARQPNTSRMAAIDGTPNRAQ